MQRLYGALASRVSHGGSSIIEALIQIQFQLNFLTLSLMGNTSLGAKLGKNSTSIKIFYGRKG